MDVIKQFRASERDDHESATAKKEEIQLIPVSEVTAKDEFFNIKNVTRDVLIAARRVQPQLIGVVPSNTGGFGAADTAAEVFGSNEIDPLQPRLTQLNEWVGDEVVRFKWAAA